MTEESVLFSAQTLEIKIGTSYYKRSTCKVVVSNTSKPTLLFFTKLFDRQPTHEIVLNHTLFEIIGNRVHINDYLGNCLAEIEMKNESDAESFICIALSVTKKSSKGDNSVQTFLQSVSEYEKLNQLPDTKINTSLQIRVESLQTLLTINRQDYYNFIQNFNLSSTGVRSIAWKLLLGVLPFHQSIDIWCQIISQRREDYENTRNQYHSHFSNDVTDPTLRELESTIRKDCIRTFSHLLFFKSQVIQDIIVRLLLVFSASHPEIGYKQGMTDVTAMLLLCLYCDHAKIPVVESESSSFRQHTITILDSHLRFNNKKYDEDLSLFLKQATSEQRKIIEGLHTLTSIEYLEHDCYSMFTVIIDQIQGCFIDNQLESDLNGRIDHIISIVNDYDTTIINHFANHEVMPILFFVRWIRLVLSREFSVEGVFYLWDRLFICIEDHFPVLDYCCAAMLLLHRERILKCETTADLLNEMQGEMKVNVCSIWQLCYLLWKKYIGDEYPNNGSNSHRNIFSIIKNFLSDVSSTNTRDIQTS